jgi:hypothetical protein
MFFVYLGDSMNFLKGLGLFPSLAGVVLLWIGCAPSREFRIIESSQDPYRIIGQGTVFSDIESRKNDPMGDQTIFLDPQASRDSTTGCVNWIGFRVTRQTYGGAAKLGRVENAVFVMDRQDTLLVPMESYGLRTQDKVSWLNGLTNAQEIYREQLSQNSKYPYHGAYEKDTKEVYTETGSVRMELKDFYRIADASSISLTLKWESGLEYIANRNEFYRETAVSSSFPKNLKVFVNALKKRGFPSESTPACL